jgi:hypothetical protein
LSVAGIIFLENVWWCVNLVSLFSSVIPLPTHTTYWPIRTVVTRVFRKRGSSTHLGAYYGLYCQKTGSIRTTRCWLWFCTRRDNPFPPSCSFRNVGVHVTFDVNRLSPIHFSTKDTIRVSWWSLSCLETPVVW